MDEITLMRAFLRAAPVDTEQKYERATELFEQLWGSPEGSHAAQLFHLLAEMIESYEDANTSLGLPDPIDAIKFRMEDLGWKPVDLQPFLGSRAMVYKILNRRRPLTLPMIRALEAGMGIPIEVLAQEYDVDRYDSERARA
jgi:HTH-type transcriptional regulator/antitoxin HigA